MAKKKKLEAFRLDLREEYRGLFWKWANKDLPAQHRFVDCWNGTITLSFKGDPIIESEDGREWKLSERKIPPHAVGYFKSPMGKYHLAVESGWKCYRSDDYGETWEKIKIPTAAEVHLRELGNPNIFTGCATTRGNIILAGDNFLGQEGPDGQTINSVVSENWGKTWTVCPLFAPAEPLPMGPEGFGEPSVVELSDRRIWMVMRSLYGELWQCISRDNGYTWNCPTPTGLASPISNCYAKRSPGGATVLCWNFRKPNPEKMYEPRDHLAFAISRDCCRTWTCPVTVEEGAGQYPTIFFSNKYMFIMYQSGKGAGWGDLGLTLVAYNLEAVNELPPWTKETMRPYIDAGLVAPWLQVACDRPQRATID